MVVDASGNTVGVGDRYLVVGQVTGIDGNVVFLDTEGRPITVDGRYIAKVADLGGGGVTDHGALTGLSDNDHPQYARVIQNLADLADVVTARDNLGLGDAALVDIGTAPGTAAAGDHGHTLADISDAGTAAAANLGTASGDIVALTTGGKLVLPAGLEVDTTAVGNAFIVDDATGYAYVAAELRINASGHMSVGHDTTEGKVSCFTGALTFNASTGQLKFRTAGVNAIIVDASTQFVTVYKGIEIRSAAGASLSVDATTGVVSIPTSLEVTGTASGADPVNADDFVTLGYLGDAATKDTGTTAGTVAAGDHTHTLADVTDSGALAALDGLDLGDLDNVTLGTLFGGELLQWNAGGGYWQAYTLPAYAPFSHTHTVSQITDAGDSAKLDVGTTAGTVAAGNHGHADLDVLQTDGAPLFGHAHPWVDEFFDQSYWNGNTGGSGTSFQVGDSNFSFLHGSIGAVRLTCGTGTASTDYRALRPSQLTSTSIDYDYTANEWIVGFRVATNADTDMRCRVGVWAATITGVSADAGFSFEWDTDSTANVQCRVHDGTSGADTDSGVTAASFNNTLRWCEIRLTSAGATFRIDGTTVATVTTGLPTGANSMVYPQIAVAGAGTAWRSIIIDTFVMAYAPGNGIEALI